MNSKTTLTILSAYNAIIGALLYFAATSIASASMIGAPAEAIEAATSSNMGTGAIFLGFGVFTFFVRGAESLTAKNAQLGWGIGGSIILIELLLRMSQNNNFTPPIAFIITGAVFIAFAFFWSF